MKLKLLLIFLMACSSTAYGQMNFQDSTAQVISYWAVGDTHEYSVVYQTLQYSEGDTTKNETMTYDVEVVVKDSTESDYVVSWTYGHLRKLTKNSYFVLK